MSTITRIGFLQLLDRVEGEYLTCWQVLVNIKKNLPISKEELFDFQPRLLSALLDLDQMYRTIISEEKRLIQNKISFSNQWFQRRMKTLKTYRDSLKKVMCIGRHIGDAFAWMFYMREREYLGKHFEHEPMTHTPPGIGGIGELEFLKQIRGVEHQIAIYHGTTTFLRVGDVSFFDLRTLKFTALGELKSEKVGSNELAIRLHIIGPKHTAGLFPSMSSSETTPRPLSDSMQQRLQRQLKTMSTTFDIPKPMERNVINYASNINELAILAKKSSRSPRTYRKIGDGLLVICFRSNRRQKFSLGILHGSQADINKKVQGVEKWALEIMDRSTTENSLCITHHSRNRLVKNRIPW